MLIGNHGGPNQINLNATEIPSSNNRKLLCVHIDKKLIFDVHTKSLYMKAVQKLSALARINRYLTLDQTLLLINSVIKSQLSYSPLIWMFCLRSLKSSLNCIHEYALR